MKDKNPEKMERLAALMKASSKTMVLTGAGISTDSGIPDFRSRGKGLWEKTDPMEFLTRKVLLEDPAKFYGHIYGRKNTEVKVMPKPNEGHKILAELESAGLISGIITQNVDRLHQKAGSKNVIEVHGNIFEGYCLQCGRTMPEKEMRRKVESGEVPPLCNYCGGVVRPSVILFGDPLPAVFEKAKEETMSSDLLLIVGSSLTVSPVNSLATLAPKAVIINREPTRRDKNVLFYIREEASQALQELKQALLE